MFKSLSKTKLILKKSKTSSSKKASASKDAAGKVAESPSAVSTPSPSLLRRAKPLTNLDATDNSLVESPRTAIRSPLSPPPPEAGATEAKRIKLEEDLKENNGFPVSSSTPARTRKTSGSRPLCSRFGRHTVSAIKVDPAETRLRLKSEDGEDVDCLLKQSWARHASENVSEGDTVNVLDPSTPSSEAAAPNSVVVDDTSGLLVVNPDRLVSGTSIVATMFCQRKALLGEMFKGFEGGNKTMFVGTVLHELLQESLKSKAASTADISDALSRIMKRKTIVMDMLTLGISADDLKKETEPFLPHVLYFIEKYVLGKASSGGPPNPAFSSSQSKGPPPRIWKGCVSDVVDIEENIWSPRLGIKGKVDLTVDAKLEGDYNSSPRTIPLELKTGRASGSAEHRGQVIMYSMMMSERRPDPEAGLLLYLRNSSVQEIKAGVHEKRGLVQMRNEAARYLTAKVVDEGDDVRSQAALPPPIENRRICSTCPHLLTCALYQKVRDDPTAAAGSAHPMADLVPATLEHLKRDHEEFFELWSLMCAMESQKAGESNGLRNLWCMTPNQRQARGTAIAGVVLSLEKDDREYVHVFHRSDDASVPVNFQDGESVIVSTNKELAISQGVLLQVSGDRVLVALDKNLHAMGREFTDGRRTYTIDKYQYQGSGSANMVNLAKLMSDNPHAERLRRTVIDREPATFLKGLSKEVVPVVKHILRPLNRIQQKAAFKTLMAEKYVLLKGFPGTGKTTLTVAIVRMLVALKKSVLLTAYTHSAVDNVLLKLAQHGGDDCKFLRLGRQARIHPNLREFSVDRLDCEDVDALRDEFSSYPVVATTCLGLSHPAVTGRSFDYCIVDEAGQALLLSALGPLFHADKFILVGDPAQLPPVVQSDDARQLGMERSLFSALETTENAIPLTIQYRMNKEIMACANGFVYDGQLECGSEEVANRSLGQLAETQVKSVKEHLRKALSGELEDSIVFLDTSSFGVEEVRTTTEDGIVTSNLEAGLVCELVDELKRSFPSATLGVMAPFRAQVDLLRRRLSSSGGIGTSDVNTIDQFQGADRDVIIFSCTRSRLCSGKESADSDARRRKDILNDMRRLNVAITRAKSKLIFVGNKRALEAGYETFRKLFGLLDERVFQTVYRDVGDAGS